MAWVQPRQEPHGHRGGWRGDGGRGAQPQRAGLVLRSGMGRWGTDGRDHEVLVLVVAVGKRERSGA